MTFQIIYHERVVKEDILSLSAAIKQRIKAAIEQKLMSQPELFGKPLRRSLKGYRKLRVGDYRVIFRIESNLVKIFIIQDREVVYKNANLRLL